MTSYNRRSRNLSPGAQLVIDTRTGLDQVGAELRELVDRINHLAARAKNSGPLRQVIEPPLRDAAEAFRLAWAALKRARGEAAQLDLVARLDANRPRPEDIH